MAITEFFLLGVHALNSRHAHRVPVIGINECTLLKVCYILLCSGFSIEGLQQNVYSKTFLVTKDCFFKLTTVFFHAQIHSSWVIIAGEDRQAVYKNLE